MIFQYFFFIIEKASKLNDYLLQSTYLFRKTPSRSVRKFDKNDFEEMIKNYYFMMYVNLIETIFKILLINGNLFILVICEWIRNLDHIRIYTISKHQICKELMKLHSAKKSAHTMHCEHKNIDKITFIKMIFFYLFYFSVFKYASDG